MCGRINVLYSARSLLSGNVVFKQFIIPTDWGILLQFLLTCVFQVRLLFIIRLKKVEFIHMIYVIVIMLEH